MGKKGFLCCFMIQVAPFFITCELQDLLLLDGVDGTEESGRSETSVLPDKNSNSWIFQKKNHE